MVRVIIFASGTEDGGGSGFENLVRASRSTPEQQSLALLLDADIVAVVSNHERGGVSRRAAAQNIPFIYFPGPFTAENYQKIVAESGADYIALSGWIRHVKGLDPTRTFNIHPALLSQFGGRFGGKGMWGHHVHEAVKKALDAGEITESGLSMHFVTDEFDRGPIFFEHRVPLTKGMSADDIGEAVNKAEHEWQPRMTNAVIHGEISWDGTDPGSLRASFIIG